MSYKQTQTINYQTQIMQTLEVVLLPPDLHVEKLVEPNRSISNVR